MLSNSHLMYLRFSPLGVQHIPTLLYFEEGSLRGHLVGTASKEAILAKLHSLTR